MIAPSKPVDRQSGRAGPTGSRGDRGLTVRQWSIIVCMAAVAIYIQTLSHGFAFDDVMEVAHNQQLRSVIQLPKIFMSTAWAGSGWDIQLYRPMTMASYVVNYCIAGLSPWSYHAVNILLHTLVTLLVFRIALLWGFTRTAAGWGALLFAVHPIHVEAVANVTGRKELLVAAFTLTMLLIHHRALRDGGRVLALAPLAFAAAMFSKETGVMALGLVLLQDRFVPRPPESNLFRSRQKRLYVVYGLLLLTYLLIRYAVVGRFGVANIPVFDNPTVAVSWPRQWMTAITVVGRGLGLLIAPVTLSPDYSYRVIPVVLTPLAPAFLLTVAGLIAIGFATWVARRSVALGWFMVGWYGLTLLPASNLLWPIGTIFGERLLYLPSVAFCLFAGYLLANGWGPSRLSTFPIILGVVLVALGLRTISYAAVWKDDLTLFTAAVQAAPDSTKVHLKLGDALAAQGRFAEAIPEFQKALAIAPDNYKAGLNQAAAELKLNRLDAAEQTYRHVLAGRPKDADALHGFGVLRRTQGRMAEAIALWNEALAANPKHAHSLCDLGTVQLLEGEWEKAGRLFERATIAAPDFAEGWYNLGIVCEHLGATAPAREAWRNFLAIDEPEYADQRRQIQRRLTAIHEN